MNEENVNEQLNTSQIVDLPEDENKDWSEEVSPTEKFEIQLVPLLREDDIEEWQSRWNSIQIGFVDEPSTSVKQADELVTEVLRQIGKLYSEKRATLQSRWNTQEGSTEDQRMALQSYRSFFTRLLNL